MVLGGYVRVLGARSLGHAASSPARAEAPLRLLRGQVGEVLRETSQDVQARPVRSGGACRARVGPLAARRPRPPGGGQVPEARLVVGLEQYQAGPRVPLLHWPR